jgi:hypothetical protein
MAPEFLSFLEARMSSSARHSATVLMVLRAFFLATRQSWKRAKLTLLKEETSTACLLATPPFPILVESSLGPELQTALTTTWTGLSPVVWWMISRAHLMILMALTFLTSVSSFEHKATNESLNKRASSLSESSLLVSTGSVWDEDLRLDLLDSNVVLEVLVRNSQSLVVPSAEELKGGLEAVVAKL